MSEQVETKKTNRKPIIIAIVVIVIIAVLMFVLTADMRTYSKASELESSGAYTDAIAIYETILDYKDVSLSKKPLRSTAKWLQA